MNIDDIKLTKQTSTLVGDSLEIGAELYLLEKGDLSSAVEIYTGRKCMFLPRCIKTGFDDNEKGGVFLEHRKIDKFTIGDISVLRPLERISNHILCFKIGDEIRFAEYSGYDRNDLIAQQKFLETSSFPVEAKPLEQLSEGKLSEIIHSTLQTYRGYNKEIRSLTEAALFEEAMHWTACRATGQEVPEAAPSDEECKEFIRQQVALRKLVSSEQGKGRSAA